jgi:hypothetical protein
MYEHIQFEQSQTSTNQFQSSCPFLSKLRRYRQCMKIQDRSNFCWNSGSIMKGSYHPKLQTKSEISPEDILICSKKFRKPWIDHHTGQRKLHMSWRMAQALVQHSSTKKYKKHIESIYMHIFLLIMLSLTHVNIYWEPDNGMIF